MGRKREARWFSLSWPAILLDTVETGRQKVADSCSWRQVLCTQLPPTCSMTPWAPRLHRLSPGREHEGGWGSAASPTPRCRASSAWELGAAVLGSGSVIKRSSGGTVMAAGSSPALPVPGPAWVGRGHQRTASTQQPLARKLPGCPTPSASDCRHSDCPDIALAAMGWMGPPFCPAQVAPHQTLQLLTQDIQRCCCGTPRV